MNDKLKNWVSLGLPLTTLLTLGSLHLRSLAAEGEGGRVKQSSEPVSLNEDVPWSPLNPARGDESPQAANLWGDRGEDGATGFLVRFKDGFSSPPHIHNVTYRGIVISGEIHNDDPGAAELWMPQGSYWTQPAGEVHITAAKGQVNVAYIEIDSGPYLVLPSEQASDNGERPLNLHASNIVWQDASESARLAETESAGGSGPATALLWMKDDAARTNGSLLKLPAGFQGTIRGKGEIFRAIGVEGQVSMQLSEGGANKLMKPAHYFTTQGDFECQVTVEGGAEAILYIRHAGRYTVGAK
ncbi:MAG: DUF4437 domain-containing protein [Verrucomicrobiota bacterium JB023]|nr:DUF4437 domain-containing protein [Verrucomicrobiota bacterium JB023]